MSYPAQTPDECTEKVSGLASKLTDFASPRCEKGKWAGVRFQPLPSLCSAEVLVKTWINSNIEQDPWRPLRGLMVSDRQGGLPRSSGEMVPWEGGRQ